MTGSTATDGSRRDGRIMGATAAAVALAAVGCGVCCVLPFALPAAALATAGGILAWFAGAYAWVTVLAVTLVAGAWAWVGVRCIATKRQPARLTVITLITATLFLTVGLLWPRIELFVAALLGRV